MRTPFVILATVALLAASATGQLGGCLRPCPLLLFPHCGSDGVTYPNLCALETAQCRNPQLSLAGNPGEPCASPAAAAAGGASRRRLQAAKDPCRRRCTREYAPHCGSDGVTYGNKCLFEIARCQNKRLKLVGTVQCDAASPSSYKRNRRSLQSCLKPCTIEFHPHCGSDGTTYPNRCSFTVAQCQDPSIVLAKPPGQPCDGGSGRRLHPAGAARECDRFCPLNFFPQCGSDGVTYGNQCNFQVAKCKDPSLKLAAAPGTPCSSSGSRRRLRDCDKPCTREYFPHCGSDGVTYGNRCNFEIAKCKNQQLKLAATPGTPCNARRRSLRDCDVPCTREYIPHCGSDGVTYANRCMFQVARCKNPQLSLAGAPGTPCV